MQDKHYRRNGITASPQTRHPLKDTPCWQSAKDDADGRGLANARHIIEQLWQLKLSYEVAERIKGMHNVCFVTVPSTTGRNQLPIALAERLQADLQIGHVIIGERIAISGDLQPMKDVPLVERPFTPRRYKLRQQSLLSRKTPVVIVEDIMSSGASAKAFADCLLANDIPVVTTVCLLGKPKLFAEPVLVRDLQRSFKKHNINLDAKQVANVLAKNQVLFLVENIDRRKDAIPSITERISRLLDAGAFRNVGSNS